MNAVARQGTAAVAARWRDTRPDLADRGVVVVNRAGEACGWMDCLRNPENWEPGCTAVDVEGREWVATGGDDYNGASEWVPGGELMSAEPGEEWDADSVEALHGLIVMLYETLDPVFRERLVDNLMACPPALQEGGAPC